MRTFPNTTQTTLIMSDLTVSDLLEQDFDDVLVADFDEDANTTSVIEMAKKAATKKEDAEDEDAEDDAEEGDDEWEKSEEDEDWDPDFEEFDVPKKGAKTAGGKKEEEEDDLDMEEDFDDLDNFDEEENFDDDY